MELKIVNTELFRYTYQRDKFLGIIQNIAQGTENFYPDEAIVEFRVDIDLINAIINGLKESSGNIMKSL